MGVFFSFYKIRIRTGRRKDEGYPEEYVPKTMKSDQFR